jgi:LTXXQ motif family protein
VPNIGFLIAIRIANAGRRHGIRARIPAFAGSHSIARRTTMKTPTSLTIAALTIIFLSGISLPALAQTAAPDAHHPPETMNTGQPGMMDMIKMMQMMQMMHMMGQGSQSMPGMGMSGMGMSGMGMSGMGMPGMGMPSMGMSGMGMSGMDMAGMDMPGMGMIDRVEGRLAFLRAELKIADAQAKAWDAFAQALRDNAKGLGRAHAAMHTGTQNAQPTLSQRLASQEAWLSARLDGIRAIKSAFDDLHAALSPDQRKTADELLEFHMGMMRQGPMPQTPQMPMGGTAP